jgi:hypothetical protein
MLISCGTIFGCQRPRQTGHPLVKKGLNLFWPELPTYLLQPSRVRTTRKAVVQRFKRDARSTQLLLGPLMSIQAHFDRIRRVGPDLDETRPKLSISHVKVIHLDEDGLARKLKPHALAFHLLASFEARQLFLGHANEDDTLRSSELAAVPRCNVILALPLPKLHNRNTVRLREGFHVGRKATTDLAQQSRRCNHRTTLSFQEVHQRTRSLHRWHVAIQIHPAHTFNVQRHMVAQQFRYRRHGHILQGQGYASCGFLPSHSVSADADTRRFEAKLR